MKNTPSAMDPEFFGGMRLMQHTLKVVRRLRGLDVETVSEQAGISVGELRALEGGDVENPALGVIEALSKVYRVRLGFLVDADISFYFKIRDVIADSEKLTAGRSIHE